MGTTGVILDSGNVLLKPVTGVWFPPAAFGEVLAQRALPWDTTRLDEAVAVAGTYLDEIHSIPVSDEAAERFVWLRYYELLLSGVGVEDERRGLAAAMHDLWEASLPVEPYSWTVPVLEELAARQLPVVLLSDAWPSLRRFYRELGLDGYLKEMVISAEQGVSKPDSRMYAKSLELLEMKPGDVVFVDDWPENVHAAVGIGIRGIRLCHEDAESDPTTEEITDLRELLALV